MADSEFSHKGSTKVEEKFKGTNLATFSLEMKSIFYHLRCDRLIYDKKPRPVRHVDAFSPEWRIHEKEYQDWVRLDKTAQAANRQNTAMTHSSDVHREDHDTALKIWERLHAVFRLSGQCASC